MISFNFIEVFPFEEITLKIMGDLLKSGIPSKVCPGSSDTFFVVTSLYKWDTTSWTHSITLLLILEKFKLHYRKFNFLHFLLSLLTLV